MQSALDVLKVAETVQFTFTVISMHLNVPVQMKYQCYSVIELSLTLLLDDSLYTHEGTFTSFAMKTLVRYYIL